MVGGALAHVSWFVDERTHPVDFGLVLGQRTGLALAASAAALIAAFAFQRLVRDPDWPRFAFLDRMASGAPTLLAVQAAITLVYSGLQPVLLAYHLRLTGPVGYGLAAAEVAVGFALITGVADRFGAAVLVLLVAAGFVLFPPLDALAQVHWAGIAVAVYVIGRQAVDAARPREGRGPRLPIGPKGAITALRVLTGLAILAPALGEKIWNPGLGLAFMAQHPEFNFLAHPLGQAWASNDAFVLLAGITEAVIGVLLISGLMTRLVIAAMWLPFNLGIPFLPPQELLWHLPILGIMYFLLVHGGGRRSAEAVPGGVRGAQPAAGS
ncbi:MAG: hypothetical protein NVS9B1_10350 [Candidatus Dormibacteraceae bacterium]